KYDLANMQTLYDVVSYCIGRCGINCGGIDDSLISTSLTPSDSALSLTDIKVRSDNFYDEDGEALTLGEVIEGILQPLALRMIQRAGKVYIYDINGLYTKAAKKQIVWDGSSQTLGVDVVYNNAKITWSTYAQSGNLSPETCWPESIETDATLMALNNLSGGSKNGAQYFSYHYSTTLSDWIDATDCGFTIWVATDGINAELGEGVKFFKIVPQYDGTESEGIAIFWKSVQGIKVGDSKNWSASFSSQGHGQGTIPGGNNPEALENIGGVLFKSSPVWIPPVANEGKLSLRVAIDLLIDPRFNPFESAANLMKYVEQKDWYDQFNTYGNFIYVPVTIKFQPDGSDTVYVWTNQSIVKQAVSSPVTTLNGTYGRWTTYTNDSNPNAWGYLCYYDAKDHIDTSGVLGWKKNRPAINPHKKATISILTNAENGQYIPYPNYGGGGGKLWVEVRNEGWEIVNEGTDLSKAENGPKSLWGKISWVLMKLPEIEIMNSSQFDKTIDTDDVEYNAQLNSAAKEPIEIETICGTSAEGVPTARGAYFNAATGKQITQLSRAGRTTQVEDLLIGTLYSQFAQRRTTLSGEAQLMYDPIAVYTEANQDGKLFMATEEVQDVRMDCSDAVYVEIRPDEYKRNNE
ncbi:MAG: hypothetical protein IJ382_03595, partial [Flavobacteriales bacterium]|nr:hypothetical protein [Flavobacteriales bacterium]